MIIKPLAFPELLARIRALLRRGCADAAPRLKLSGLEMDLVARTVTRDGETIELTGREFDLLQYLPRHQGRIVSREMLRRDVWHETTRARRLDNVIDVHIFRLRRKVDDPYDEKLIHTARGVGFVARLAEAHGGRIEVESEVGRGSVFRIILPTHEIRTE